MDKMNNEPQDVPPGFIPLYDPNGSMINKMYPYNLVPMQPPINKIYNISLSDPLGNHSYINKIYEDVLPSDKTVYSFLTVKERDVIKKFLRNSILDKYDGEDFTIQGSKKSLLSWIKIYDINPYRLKGNPYDDIPTGFLLFRSAYPIRYNKEDRVLKATPTSVAINIRMYQLSIGAAKCSSIKDIDCNNFDVWRDLHYYEWVDTITKQKISPNFINMLLYVFDSESKVGFDKLDILKKQKDPLGFENQLGNNKKINDNYKLTLQDIANPNFQIIDGQIVRNKNYDIIKKKFSNTEPILKLADELTHSLTGTTKPVVSGLSTHIDLSKADSKVLVVLTEAPNTNIIKWNSKIYQSYGSVDKMISTGYHNPDVWSSILFQLVYACAILQRSGVCFENFSLGNNVFIKDVQTDNTGKSCWLYKINGIDYYIPNYGYLVVIDSNYADIINYNPADTQRFKIYGSIYKELNGSKTDFNILVQKGLQEIMNNDGKNFVGNTLDDKVRDLINNIYRSLSLGTSIIDIIPSLFSNFLNNKVGTLLTKFEKENLSIFNKPTYVDGSLMIRQNRFDEYEWVMFKGTNGNKKIIITKDRTNNNDTFQTVDVFSSSLFSYFQNVAPDGITVIETYTY